MEKSVNFEPEPLPAGPLLVIAPHLDDGVFSCGRLLASAPVATVATVFAGRPPADSPLTEWDRAAGFGEGDDVIGTRREEDRHALALLGVRPHWLDLLDSQYGGAERQEVVDRLEELVARSRADTVFFPMGLFHSDHLLTCDAMMTVMKHHPERRWFAYEDALYRRIEGQRSEALAYFRRLGLSVRPVAFVQATDAAARKEEAVACYRSQLQALATPGRPGHGDLALEEAYWELSRRFRRLYDPR